MNYFKKLIAGLRPANREWNYMEVKELSEVMEAAHAEARHAIQKYLVCKKDYQAACDAYCAQCQAKSFRRAA